MAVTALDPATALLLIDLQRGIATLPLAHPAEEVLDCARALVAAFRARDLPVAIVTVDGRPGGRVEQPRPDLPRPSGWTDPVDGLAPLPGDIAVVKRSQGAFMTTDLGARLTARGVTQVVIAGISTSAGVESTARQAYELGLNVTFATDAMTDRDLAAHEHSITRVFPRLGERGTTREILALLGAGRPR